MWVYGLYYKWEPMFFFHFSILTKLATCPLPHVIATWAYYVLKCPTTRQVNMQTFDD